MTDRRRLWAVTPSVKPVGGVVKVFDYVLHALDLGWDVTVASARGADLSSPLFRMEAFRHLPDDPRVRFLDDLRIAPTVDDVVLFSWPSHVVPLTARLPHGFPLARLVHLVQNTRHGNPTFAEGWGVRALPRTLTRIMINELVLDAVRPFLGSQGITEVIPLGHRAEHFVHEREVGLPDLLTVGHTTWKSDVGDRVADLLADDPRFRFRAIREPVDWDDLRDLYTGVDVFLCAPGPQEGFYLPGLEAMAAGALVLTPDVGGNLAYAWFDENCLEVPFEDEHGYAEVLRSLPDLSEDRVEALRSAGRERVRAHALDRERDAFSALLDRVEVEPGPRVQRALPSLPRRPRSSRFHVLTGLPRSGTTLATSLLNRLDDVVALSEPLRPPDLMPAGSAAELVDELEDFFREQRRSALEDGVVRSKVVDGHDTDNYVGDERDAQGRRRLVAETGALRVTAPVSEQLRIVVKDLALSTALLPALLERFDVSALVRNPVAVLASWDTVAMPVSEGHAPHAEWFDADLARSLQVEGRRDRQLLLLDWFFARFRDLLPRDRVVRYEDVIDSGGAALSAVVPEAEALREDLGSRNTNAAYTSVDLGEIVDAVLGRPDAAWWTWYDRGEVEALRPVEASAG